MKPTKIEELEAGLAIDRGNLDEALIQQPEIFYRVSEQLVRVTSQRDAAKQALIETEAEVDQRLRVKARTDEIKKTETEFASEKILHPDAKAARYKLNELTTQMGTLEALKEAYQQRSYVLKELTALYAANYFSDSTTSSASRTQSEVNAKEGRAAMSAARRERM